MNSPFPHNPLHLAREAQQMAQKANGNEGQVFQKVAMVSMCVVAVTGASQILLELWRELHRRDRDNDRGRGR